MRTDSSLHREYARQHRETILSKAKKQKLHLYYDYHQYMCEEKYCDVLHKPIFINGTYYLLTYNKCVDFDRVKILQNCIIKGCKHTKICNSEDIHTGYDMSRDLKEYRLRQQALGYYHTVHCLYGMHNRFAICSSINVIDKIVLYDRARETFKTLMGYIVTLGLETSVKYELTKLHDYNMVYIEEAEIIKTTDLLIKQIRNYDNTKES